MKNTIGAIIEEINGFHLGNRSTQPRLYVGVIQWAAIKKEVVGCAGVTQPTEQIIIEQFYGYPIVRVCKEDYVHLAV